MTLALLTLVVVGAVGPSIGYYLGKEVGREEGRQAARSAMLKHPSIRARHVDKQIRATA